MAVPLLRSKNSYSYLFRYEAPISVGSGPKNDSESFMSNNVGLRLTYHVPFFGSIYSCHGRPETPWKHGWDILTSENVARPLSRFAGSYFEKGTGISPFGAIFMHSNDESVVKGLPYTYSRGSLRIRIYIHMHEVEDRNPQHIMTFGPRKRLIWYCVLGLINT